MENTNQPAQPVRGRFAPSPSGRMHLGNIFCALMCWLAARSAGGSLVLRIEDLDTLRCTRENARLLVDDLRWLGLDWDEGPDIGGPNAPYFQSDRFALYAQKLAQLEAKGLVYPCFCSRAEIHAANAPHQSDGSVVYAGTCRGLSEAQRAEKAASRAPALRLVVPDREYRYTDGHYGPGGENLAESCGDFILRRSDGVYAYQLCVVVDDIQMGVNQIVRGRDLLGSIPRQSYLYELLGAKPPQYYHIPMLVAPDGRRLSKREADLDMGELRGRYAAPEPILGRLAHRCGLLKKEEPISARELLPLFDWAKLPQQDIIINPGDF